MNTQRKLVAALSGLLLVSYLVARAQPAPTALRTDLLLYPNRVWHNGFLTNLTLDDAAAVDPANQLALIRSQYPSFSWVLPADRSGSRQTAYRILLSSSRRRSEDNQGDVWDSGKVVSAQNVGILLPTTHPLDTSRTYFWKVWYWDELGRESPFSLPQAFRTAAVLARYATPWYPLVKGEEQPRIQRPLANGSTLYDFGRDAFGQLVLTVSSRADHDSLLLHVGEALTATGHVDSTPTGTLRYRRIPVRLQRGTHRYQLIFKPDKRNTGPKAVRLPDYIGEVMPFRYVESVMDTGAVQIKQLVRQPVNYPFDDDAATFHSSDTTLNRIWELCKHTIKATSYTGLYVDGDRERIPYEGDALINQLSHYATDAEFSMAKRSLHYLVFHATWPTEWSLQNPLIAWNDYLYSGDSRSVAALYTDLNAKLMLPLARPDGLISTRTGRQSPDFLQSIHYDTFDGRPIIQDIVDWPQQGVLGLGKKESGETDGFVFRNYNAVVNAFHYRGLVVMAELARYLGKADDASLFSRHAKQVQQAFQATFIDSQTGLVRDGEGTDHSSLHANMMALAFGLVPEKNRAAVVSHIRSRGMACSVYGAQFLLDGLYDAHESDYALALLTSQAERSWYNMLRTGSTMTTEAWDTRYKPNQDWNHAWGAAPANIIVEKLMGVEPMNPAFGIIQIKPQPGKLQQASLQLATLRGRIDVSFENTPKYFRLQTTLPANSRGIVYLPRRGARGQLRRNGLPIQGAVVDGPFWKIIDVRSGTDIWEVVPD